MNVKMISLLGTLALMGATSCHKSPNAALEVSVGPKQDTATTTEGGSETEHMTQLVTQLKVDAGKVQNGPLKSALLDDVDLWQHMLDKMVHQEANGNNTGGEHHHEHNPAPASTKNAPKPTAQ